MPSFEGGLQPVARLKAFGRVREAIDPDDFRGGFAVWSGTSFSAPILAGDIADSLVDRLGGTDPDVVSVAWSAVSECTDLTPS
jgi:serine protease